LWAVHTRQEGPLRGLRLGAGVFAEDARPGDNAGTFELPGYVRVDLLAAYEWAIGSTRLTAQLNVENALDQEYFKSPILIGGSLTATLAFYHLTKQDVLTPDPVDPEFSVQIGAARSRGIELDVSGALTPALELIASLAYTDRYESARIVPWRRRIRCNYRKARATTSADRPSRRAG
jgi:outer membrane receptor protein involved in Fe transport